MLNCCDSTQAGGGSKAKASGKGRAKKVRSTEELLSTKKGKMVSELLLRWWYVIEWPAEEDVGQLGPDFMKLDGFSGVIMGYKVSKSASTSAPMTDVCLSV